MAIDMELQAVAFYTNKALASSGMDSKALSRIADEEKSHLTRLKEHRNRLFLQTKE
jgi:rubrerythrin